MLKKLFLNAIHCLNSVIKKLQKTLESCGCWIETYTYLLCFTFYPVTIYYNFPSNPIFIAPFTSYTTLFPLVSEAISMDLNSLFATEIKPVVFSFVYIFSFE